MSAAHDAVRRAYVTVRAMMYEVRGAGRIASDARSAARLSIDSLLYRVLRVADPRWANRPRRVRVRPDVELRYRMNRGDFLAIRELWMLRIYEPPFSCEPGAVIDLGANIGLTTLWYARRFRPRTIVCVEPLPENVRLLKSNLEHNGVEATVVEAAVGAEDGTAGFSAARDFTAGRLDPLGSPVRQVSMPSLLELLPAGASVDLLKIDIEGAEQELLGGDLSWLDRVRAIVIEFHLDRVDRPKLVERVEQAGFAYIPAGTVHPDSMDAFIRVTEPTS